MDTLNISISYNANDVNTQSSPLKAGADTTLPFNSGGSYCIPLKGINEYYTNMKNQVKKAKIYQTELVP